MLRYLFFICMASAAIASEKDSATQSDNYLTDLATLYTPQEKSQTRLYIPRSVLEKRRQSNLKSLDLLPSLQLRGLANSCYNREQTILHDEAEGVQVAVHAALQDKKDPEFAVPLLLAWEAIILSLKRSPHIIVKTSNMLNDLDNAIYSARSYYELEMEWKKVSSLLKTDFTTRRDLGNLVRSLGTKKFAYQGKCDLEEINRALIYVRGFQATAISGSSSSTN